MKNTVRFAHILFNFISLYLLVLTFVMKLKDANYKSHWTILVLFDQWKKMSDLNMSHEEMSDFVSFPLLGFTLVIKLRNFDFQSYWKTLNIFLVNKKRWQIGIYHFKQWLIWFRLRCLRRILAISWEIRILNFI